MTIQLPYQDSLSLRFRWVPLTKPLPISRRLILQQARGQCLLPLLEMCFSSQRNRQAVRSPPTAWERHGFIFYFNPRWGFFSPFPHGTISLSVTQEYLALQGGPCWFTRDSTCPMLLGLERKLSRCFRLLDSHHLGCGIPPTASPSSMTLRLLSHNPVLTV